jgi:ankyrin repeat protein
MEVLLKRNANPNQGMHGVPPIMLAIQRGLPEALEVLVKHNAELKGIFVGGKTPLELAKANGDPRIIKLLEPSGKTK